jgi:hypothetical protein
MCVATATAKRSRNVAMKAGTPTSRVNSRRRLTG